MTSRTFTRRCLSPSMSRTSSTGTVPRFVPFATAASAVRPRGRVSLALVATLALALPLSAGRNDERKKQASDAQKAGRLDEAERLMCEIARSDAEDLDAKQLCEAYRGTMPMEKKRNDQRFNDGKEALAKGDFDTARQKFSNIKWGDHLDEARNLIAQIDARAGEDSAFTAGVNAWNGNNVAEAEANF